MSSIVAKQNISRVYGTFDAFNAINGVLSLLKKEFGSLQWTVVDAHSQDTLYIYAPLPNAQSDGDDKTGYYVGIDTQTMGCWVTGNPNWACLFNKTLNVADMSSETTEYIVSNIKQLVERYKEEEQHYARLQRNGTVRRYK